jgi:hypothetical protein
VFEGRQVYKRDPSAVAGLAATPRKAEAHQQHLLDLERVFLGHWANRESGSWRTKGKGKGKGKGIMRLPPLPVSAATASTFSPLSRCILSLMLHQS